MKRVEDVRVSAVSCIILGEDAGTNGSTPSYSDILAFPENISSWKGVHQPLGVVTTYFSGLYHVKN